MEAHPKKRGRPEQRVADLDVTVWLGHGCGRGERIHWERVEQSMSYKKMWDSLYPVG